MSTLDKRARLLSEMPIKVKIKRSSYLTISVSQGRTAFVFGVSPGKGLPVLIINKGEQVDPKKVQNEDVRGVLGEIMMLPGFEKIELFYWSIRIFVPADQDEAIEELAKGLYPDEVEIVGTKKRKKINFI